MEKEKKYLISGGCFYFANHGELKTMEEFKKILDRDDLCYSERSIIHKFQKLQDGNEVFFSNCEDYTAFMLKTKEETINYINEMCIDLFKEEE
jgi:hypothetical protein